MIRVDARANIVKRVDAFANIVISFVNFPCINEHVVDRLRYIEITVDWSGTRAHIKCIFGGRESSFL